jgi:hypothetical protein
VLETTETTTDDGTEAGRLENSTTTVDEPTTTTELGANSVAHDAGIATMLSELQSDGTTMVVGIVTTELDGKLIIVLVATDPMALDGTLAGTLDHSTKTVDEPTSITLDGANDSTHVNETATTDDELHDVGITTVEGT